MKKIWILLRDLTETGGGERVCIQLANAWSARYEVHIWSFHQGNAKPMVPLEDRVEVSYLSKGFQRAANPFRKVWNKTVYRLMQSIRIHRLVCENRPDIVFCNDGTFLPVFKSLHSKYVRLWHLRCPPRKKRVFGRYDAMVVLSGDQLAQWEQYHPAVRVIPNFLPSVPEPLPENRPPVVLSVGRMEKSDEKGFMRLLDIWAELQSLHPHPEWKLRLVGDGVLRTQICDRIRHLRLEGSVEVHPFTAQIMDEYRDASIYAMASYREGFPMVLLEAASCGLPAVAYDIHSGPGDIIVNGGSGFLIPDGQKNLFVPQLLSLMDDAVLRQRMGRAAQQRMRDYFTQEKVLRQWTDLFSELSPEI